MSGGSWDYICHRVDDTAIRLDGEKCAHRRALGKHLHVIVAALKAIEWVDSGDWVPPDDIDAIKKVFESGPDDPTLDFLLKDGEKLIQDLRSLGVQVK